MTENVPQVKPIKRKAPVLGILSLVLFGLSLCVLAPMIGFFSNLGGNGDFFDGISILGSLLCTFGVLIFPGLILGIIGITQKDRNHIPAIVGTCLNGAIILLLIGRILFIVLS